jgi:hypothetical protein
MNPPPTLLTGMENIPGGVVMPNEGEVVTIDVNGAVIGAPADYATFKAINIHAIKWH